MMTALFPAPHGATTIPVLWSFFSAITSIISSWNSDFSLNFDVVLKKNLGATTAIRTAPRTSSNNCALVNSCKALTLVSS